MPHSLPELPYPANALEPHLDARTVEIHHGKHHAAYVANFNAALEKRPDLADKPIVEILKNLPDVPEPSRMALRNQGGGVWNHTFYWNCMAPNAGGKPSGALAAAIDAAFGSFEAFQEKFQAVAMAQFGSGWGWLHVQPDKTLCICSTPNQDSPLMKGVVECIGTPILVVDVWEHAYYLNYQNRRTDYLKAWWHLVNWKVVEKLYAEAMK